MPVFVSCEGVRGAPAETERRVVQRYAMRMLEALGQREVELSVLLCDDRVMHRLNHAHRNIDRPTDVLAFAMREGLPIASASPSLGDIAISLPTAARQAKQHRVAMRSEVCLLLAHGLLHLLGLDHRTRTEERRMMARTHLLMSAALSRGRGQSRAAAQLVTKTKTSPRLVARLKT